MEEINLNFGRSFERIRCAGEVQLHEEVDPTTGALDFEKFAMHIKVRFRAEEELQLLTAHRQSGGERSVATIMYLIAIQVTLLSLLGRLPDTQSLFLLSRPCLEGQRRCRLSGGSCHKCKTRDNIARAVGLR